MDEESDFAEELKLSYSRFRIKGVSKIVSSGSLARRICNDDKGRLELRGSFF